MPSRILVVDDEENIRRLFEQRFRKERRQGLLEFEFATSADEALRYLEENGSHQLAWVLTDINMPRLNGLELLGIMLQKYRDLKVMMLTAYDDAERREKASELGAMDYLTKPIDFKGLKERILA